MDHVYPDKFAVPHRLLDDGGLHLAVLMSFKNQASSSNSAFYDGVHLDTHILSATSQSSAWPRLFSVRSLLIV